MSESIKVVLDRMLTQMERMLDMMAALDQRITELENKVRKDDTRE